MNSTRCTYEHIRYLMVIIEKDPIEENSMRSVMTYVKIVTCIVVGLHVTAPPALSQMSLKIVDILRAPDKYYNQQVKISGKVTDVRAEGEAMNGLYTLVGDNNVGVEITSDILPLVGKSYDVTVVVYQGPAADKPILREISRKEKSKSYIGWILGGVLCVMAVMLVFQGSGDVGGVDTSDMPNY